MDIPLTRWFRLYVVGQMQFPVVQVYSVHVWAAYPMFLFC